MPLELVRVTTGDGVRLDGVLDRPNAGRPSELPVDAIVCFHGTGGSFYSSTLFESLSRRFTALGIAVLRVNTRGHDMISTASTSQGPRRLGAAFEKVDDCRHDVTAWVRSLAEQRYSRIGLLGHSLGAVKAVYTSASDELPPVSRLVAISPPRLSHAVYMSSDSASVFRTTLDRAQALVNDGMPQGLMEVTFPLAMFITAEGYLDKYGPHERFDVLRYLNRLTVPSLFTYGSIEMQDHPAFRGMPKSIRESAAGNAIDAEVIVGADHFYSGKHQELADLIERWFRSPQ